MDIQFNSKIIYIALPKRGSHNNWGFRFRRCVFEFRGTFLGYS